MSHGLFTKGRFPTLLLLLAVSSLAFGQGTFSSVVLAFPQIAVGGDATAQHYVTLLQIVNNNSAATNGHFDLLSDNGSTFQVLVDGVGPQSSFDISLSPGETRQIQLTSSGDVASGWLKATYTPSQASTAALIQYRSGADLLSEVGVDPSFSTLLNTDLAFETDPTLNTGIAVSNPSSGSAFVLARLWDSSSGTLLAGTVISLGANGHIAKFVTELFSSIAGIAQMRARVSLDSCSSFTCSTAGGNGFLATALRLNAEQFTTIALTSRSAGGAQVRVLPQVAFGGPASGQHMTTVLYFTTNVATGIFGTAEIFDNDGNPLNASADGAARASSIPFTVLGNRVARVVLSGDETLRSGWIRLTLSGTVNLVTNAIFQTFNGTRVASEASVLESAPVERGLVYVKVQPGTNVGLALANSRSEPTTVSLDVFDQQGNVAARRDIVLPANGHRAQFVTDIFPELAPSSEFTGSLALHSSGTFSALALRLTGDKIATLPIAGDGMHRPAITTLVVTGSQRFPAQVRFSVSLADLDSDISTSSSSSVVAVAVIDFGSAGLDSGRVSLDGTAILNQASGTLSGVFQPPNVTGAVPAGYPATLYLQVYDALGNTSNVVSVPFTF